ncbi:uncharacterized protein G2W53_020391 [Senna tora]|uniref:Uncharacterized protein n=1 Tax=Senna tora TaxID=362788 RepID=A0A834TXT8_9FABA|nr:uncharacterized protein G2W53_020391 [Senna tora]
MDILSDYCEEKRYLEFGVKMEGKGRRRQ